MPVEGLVIVRDGDPGEPDVTLNPRTEFYSHRVEIESYIPRDSMGDGEAGRSFGMRSSIFPARVSQTRSR